MIQRLSLNDGWEFRRSEGTATDADWSLVTLPHSPFISDLDGHDHWFGRCLYRRRLRLDVHPAGSSVTLFFGAAMHSARVCLDGVEIGTHRGGYLPFEVAIESGYCDGRFHELLVELDNRENPDIPPGKAYGELDFCWYAGLYRNAELRIYPPVHISDPVSAGQIAGGGVFFRTLELSPERAVVSIRVHACNSGLDAVQFIPSVALLLDGASVASAQAPVTRLASGETRHVEIELIVPSPRLWDVRSPILHDLQVYLLSADETSTLDKRTERVGIRRIGFSRSGGFTLNGQRLRLRGTNRHQEQPRAGYAAPPAADRRDARRIKEAGFDYVRLSHYPQSTAFLEACDELGLVVMNAIPGWQYLGGDSFRQACYQNARDLVRRDRNHPCVVLWELSLNETSMDESFMEKLHRIGHEEYPGDQMFTCGWLDRYDVYIRARQHGELHDWRNGDKALVVSEYGDWEFYAQNEGFDQTTGAGLLPVRMNSRQRRKDGEQGLLRQAANQALALNDTLSSPAVLDGQWCCFDYARGYHPERAACGVMDLHRVAKFSYYLYRSQRDAVECGQGWAGGPMVFIASHWVPESALRITVFSNCEEVSLCLNGRLVSHQRPTISENSRYLPHPPLFFDLPFFEAGTLSAEGLIDGKSVARHHVSTPGAPARIEIVTDRLGIDPSAGESDLCFAQAMILDLRGNLCVQNEARVRFSINGSGRIIGPETLSAEAGIASVVLWREPNSPMSEVRAEFA